MAQIEIIAILTAAVAAAHWLGDKPGGRMAKTTGIEVPAILILTTLALALAQTRPVARLRGAEMLGMYGAYLFLAALAAYCEVAALRETGQIGLLLMAFMVILILVHGTFVVLAGRLMRQSPEVVAVASATTVGGSTVVLPLVYALQA